MIPDGYPEVQDWNAEHRRRAMAECDHPEEFAKAGEAVARALTAGLSCEVSIAPGNGTRYAFLFAPTGGTSYLSPREGLESAGAGEDAVMVAMLNIRRGGSVYPLDLIGRREMPAPSYLLEKWFPEQKQVNDDVFVLERLLWEIGTRSGTWRDGA